jgi:hypothetical protein
MTAATATARFSNRMCILHHCLENNVRFGTPVPPRTRGVTIGPPICHNV